MRTGQRDERRLLRAGSFDDGAVRDRKPPT
jgi:hypothetical protein